jgi:hypothetical protein
VRFIYRADVALPPREVFERLRHYERIYPDLHPAHEAPEPPYEPRLLDAGYRFGASERFGAEHRRYDFTVTAFDPEAPHLALTSATVTTLGRVRIRSRLVVDFAFAPTPGGCAVTVTQTVSFGRAWLDRLLSHPALWRRVAAHADEECEAAVRILLSPNFQASVAAG